MYAIRSYYGYEGDDLVFTVNHSGLQSGTINRTITINGWNSVTNATAT